MNHMNLTVIRLFPTTSPCAGGLSSCAVVARGGNSTAGSGHGRRIGSTGLDRGSVRVGMWP